MEGSVWWMKTFEQCIEHILMDIERRKTVDYGDKNSVRRYNAAYDRMAKNVDRIESMCPECREAFFQYIYHDDPAVSETFACFVFYRNSFSIDQKKDAVRRIEQLLLDGAITGLSTVGYEFLLPRWKQALDN